MRSIRIVVLALTALLIARSASAHRVYFEPQEKAEMPWWSPETDDYSWENPGVLDNIWGNKAIFGWLDFADYDVYQFTLDDTTPPFGRALVALQMSPACLLTQGNFVSVALLGPGLPTPPETLPFELPEGMGAIAKINPEFSWCEERPIFYEKVANISWFLPEGMSEQCIMGNPPSVPPMATCDLSNIIVTPRPPAPQLPNGTYYIVVWSEQIVPQDYTLAIGFIDAGYYQKTPDEPLTYDNAHLHLPCSEPYPWN